MRIIIHCFLSSDCTLCVIRHWKCGTAIDALVKESGSDIESKAKDKNINSL